MSVDDRLSPGYEPRFDLDLALGKQGELFVKDIADALRDGSCEVKRDARADDTGNLYIECQCFRQGAWKNSGIATTRATSWAFVVGNGQVTLVVPVAALHEFCRERWNKGRVTEMPRGSHPTKGIVVPISVLVSWFAARKPGAA